VATKKPGNGQSAGDLVAMLANAGEDDIQAIDKAIADAEERKGAIEREILSLRAARKLIDTRINGPKPRTPRVKANEIPARIEAVYKHLSENGPTRANVIATALGIHQSTVTRLLKQHDWFVCKDGHYWDIAKATTAETAGKNS